MKMPFGIVALVLASAVYLALPARAEDDAYIRGYAGALLEREFDVGPNAVRVANGVVTIHADLSDSDFERVEKILLAVDGVQKVALEPADTRPKGWAWLAGKSEFAPLTADPRWPRFGAAYSYYLDDDELGSVGAASFGESLTIVRHNPSYGGSWDVGIQAGVFAIFDFDRSFDLVNADYVGGIPVAYARGDFSALLRLYHQSSHLGDEYLLRNRTERVNLSYEAIHMLLSYELPFGARTYGGGAYIFRIEPEEIAPWRVQSGIEWTGPSLSDGYGVRPVAAVDVQLEEESRWRANVAPVAGLKFERRWHPGPDFQLMLHYFYGRSPNGQFYERRVEYFGLTAQFPF